MLKYVAWLHGMGILLLAAYYIVTVKMSYSYGGIPPILLFNGKQNLLLNHSAEHPFIIRNIYETISMFADHQVIFFDDGQCRAILGELQEEWYAGERDFADMYRNSLNLPDFGWSRRLLQSYDLYEDGRIRSDMCRLGMLWKHGGFYFDNDIKVLKAVDNYILPNTKFITCMAENIVLHGNPPGYFQAFVGSEPRHIVLKLALRYHVLWFDIHDSAHREMITGKRTQNSSAPNLGVVFLRMALENFVGNRKLMLLELHGYLRSESIQLLYENVVGTRKYAPEQDIGTLCRPCLIKEITACSYGVYDPFTNDLIFKSRVLNPKTRQKCDVYCNMTCKHTDWMATRSALQKIRDKREKTLYMLDALGMRKANTLKDFYRIKGLANYYLMSTKDMVSAKDIEQ